MERAQGESELTERFLTSFNLPTYNSLHAMSDIESYLTTLEDSFYEQGLSAGTSHGELHGLFEGRALGKEQAWTLWEEVGYYNGVATFWKAILSASGTASARYAMPARCHSAPKKLSSLKLTFPPRAGLSPTWTQSCPSSRPSRPATTLPPSSPPW